MTDRILEFLRNRREDGPCLVLDLEVVRENYASFAKALPDTRVFYAVKANPDPRSSNCWRDLVPVSTPPRLSRSNRCWRRARARDRISYGNTIKKERDIKRAFELGVRLFAVDCEAEVEKIARAAPGAKVFCRILCDAGGAEWPLSRKFGCAPEMAPRVLEHAHRLGLMAFGLSFHVGSQQPNPRMWDGALKAAAAIFRDLAERGIHSADGQPRRRIPNEIFEERTGGEDLRRRRSCIRCASHFGNHIPETIIEPGRGMVGNAGVIEAEVVLISRKSDADKVKWVYLDIGKFNGLAETMDEMIRYPIRTAFDGGATEPCVIAGPSCDSVDVLYEKDPYLLPVSLEIGSKVLIEGTGAYTTTYSSVGFNGFPPLKSYVI